MLKTTRNTPLHRVSVWQRDGIRWEMHRYAPGPAGAHPRHMHAAYQIGYSPDFDGEYWYRGEHVAVPRGSVHIIHPGEVHAPRDPKPRSALVRFPTAFVDPALLQRACTDTGTPDAPPWLPPVVRDRDLAGRFLRLMRASLRGEALRVTSLQRDFFAALVRRYGGRRARPEDGDEHEAVRQVRAYLHARLAAAVTLEELGTLVDLHPHYLARVFRREVGLPPYRYLTQLRVQEAARRLARGEDIATVALVTGFADQPHLTRHFKRIVGVTPGQYRPAVA